MKQEHRQQQNQKKNLTSGFREQTFFTSATEQRMVKVHIQIMSEESEMSEREKEQKKTAFLREEK